MRYGYQQDYAMRAQKIQRYWQWFKLIWFKTRLLIRRRSNLFLCSRIKYIMDVACLNDWQLPVNSEIKPHQFMHLSLLKAKHVCKVCTIIKCIICRNHLSFFIHSETIQIKQLNWQNHVFDYGHMINFVFQCYTIALKKEIKNYIIPSIYVCCNFR